MSRLLDGDNDVLRFSGTFLDATATETTAIVFAEWIQRARTGFGTEEALLYVGPAGQTNHLLALCIDPTVDTVTARIRTTSNAQIAGPAISDLNWHLVIGKWVAGVPSVSVDGANFVSSGSSRDPTLATALFSIGGNLSATPALDYNGKVAYPTVWTGINFANGDAAALWNSGAGINPLAVQTANVVAHWPLTNNESPEIDVVNAFDLTVSGATFSTSNPFTLGTSITATLQALQLIERAAAVGIDKNVIATFQAMNLAELAAVKRLSRNVIASLRTMSLTEQTSVVRLGANVSINAATQALNLIERSAAIRLSRAVLATKQSLVHTEFPATTAVNTFDPRLLLQLQRSDENPLLRM